MGNWKPFGSTPETVYGTAASEQSAKNSWVSIKTPAPQSELIIATGGPPAVSSSGKKSAAQQRLHFQDFQEIRGHAHALQHLRLSASPESVTSNTPP